jgi:hypothetical protein
MFQSASHNSDYSSENRESVDEEMEKTRGTGLNNCGYFFLLQAFFFFTPGECLSWRVKRNANIKEHKIPKILCNIQKLGEVE